MTDLLHHNILTVPDKQMADFIRVTSAPDDSVSVMAWNDDFFGKPGTKVRITDGDFKGVEGIIRRIKQNKRVVVELQGIAVAAIAFIPPGFLEPIE